jgi:hypothetical protein
MVAAVFDVVTGAMFVFVPSPVPPPEHEASNSAAASALPVREYLIISS